MSINAAEYDEKVKKTQKLIKRRDVAGCIKNIMLSYSKVKTMIVNEAVKILPNNEFVKLKQILDKDEKRYGSLAKQNKELDNTRESFKEIKKIIADEEKTREKKRNSWKIEESEHENKKVDWKREEKEHQEKREIWDREKNKIQEEKESLEQEKNQAKNELVNLKTEIKQKTEIAKNEWKKDGKIQKEALAMAIKELYEQHKTTYKDHEKLKEKAKNQATEELKENYKIDKEISEKARTKAYEEYKSNYVLEPKMIKKIEEKVIKTKYEEVLMDKGEKYSKLATAKALKNKEFAQKIIKKATDEKKSELEKDPKKIEQIMTEIKNECFFNSAKLRDSAILKELKKDWVLRGQARDALKQDKYFKEEIVNEMKNDEKMEMAKNYIKNDMNSSERTKFIKSYIDKESIKNNVSKEELEKAEKEVLGEIKTENIVLYQNILYIADFFYNFYKKFIEEELKSRFENTKYQAIYDEGIRTRNLNIFNKVIKTFSKIINFFGLKNEYKKAEEKNEIKSNLEDLKERLKIKENDRTQNKAF